MNWLEKYLFLDEGGGRYKILRYYLKTKFPEKIVRSKYSKETYDGPLFILEVNSVRRSTTNPPSRDWRGWLIKL